MSAIISDCGRFRYRLERKVVGAGNGTTVFIMVNPSTADATEDDATIRKLKGFSTRWSLGRIVVGNLFAYRAKDVKALAKANVNPVGPMNDHYLAEMIGEADRVIFAWGPLAKQPRQFRNVRWPEIAELVEQAGMKPMCLGEPCGDGHPRHPLMLPYASGPQWWTPPR